MVNSLKLNAHWYKGNITLPKNGKIRRVDMSQQLTDFSKSYLIHRKEVTLKNGWGKPPEWLFY